MTKKTSCLLLAITALLYSECPVMAIPSLGTLMPRGGQFQGSGKTDIIFDRRVEDYRTASATTYHYGASYGFADWFCLDGQIGLGNVEAERNTINELRYRTGFSGGYGFRAKLYKNDKYKTDWVCGFQHVSTHPYKRRRVEGRKYEMIWDDWQFSTTVSKDLWRLKPYCGVKWSFIYLIDKIDGDRHRRISKGSPVGLITGADIRINDYFYINAEGRFFDETALNAGFTVRFD